jgi:hypothetical protein
MHSTVQSLGKKKNVHLNRMLVDNILKIEISLKEFLIVWCRRCCL